MLAQAINVNWLRQVASGMWQVGSRKRQATSLANANGGQMKSGGSTRTCYVVIMDGYRSIQVIRLINSGIG